MAARFMRVPPAIAPHQIVILPMLQQSGFGRAVVQAIELEARAHRCDTVYAVTSSPGFFERQGYDRCDRNAVPQSMRESSQFALQPPPAFNAMVKRLS